MAEYTGGMIALIPANPQALTVPGGDPAEQIHLTLIYLGENAAELDERIKSALHGLAASIAQDRPPAVARIFGHARWNPDGGPEGDKDPATVYEMETTPELNSIQDSVHYRAREVMGEALLPEQHHPFKPHVTAGYGVPLESLEATGEVTFDRIRVALGDEVTDYPLAGRDGMEYYAMDTYTITAAADAEEIPVENELKVNFPVLIVEGVETGDGRFIEAGALGHRALPLPILAQIANPDGGAGHDGAEVIGRLETLTRTPGPEVVSKETGEPFPDGTFVWSGTGVIDGESKGGKLAQKGYLTGNSADLISVEAEFVFPEGEADEFDPFAQPEQIRMTSGKIAATTLVPIPAFAEAYLQIEGSEVAVAEDLDEAIVASSAWRSADTGDHVCLPCIGIEQDRKVPVTASVTPMFPPVSAFTDPGLDGPTAITVDEDSIPGYIEVYGHLAAWGTCHTGLVGKCVTPPHSANDYAYFNVGAVRAQDGDKLREMAVGHITMGDGGHAGLGLDAKDATAYYDNANMVLADVAAGEDAHGIWVHGVLRPGITAEQLAKFRSSPLSGDWRPVAGSLELVAALAVTVPGFPVPRARVASGAVMAIVAAGALPVAVSPEGAQPSAAERDEELERLAGMIADKLRERDQEEQDAYLEGQEELSLRARHAKARLGL